MTTLSGVYYIKNVGTGRYLSITSPTANQPLAISPTKLDKKSQWRVSSTGSGTYKLKNEEYGLEVFRPSTTIVAQGAPEGFAFYITGPETGRKIHNRESTRDGTVLTQENLKGVDQVTSAKNNNSNKNQEWVFEKAAATDPGPGPGPGPEPEPEPEPEPTPGPGPNPGSTDYPLKPGRYRITNVKTGTVIDLEKMLPGDNQKIFGFAWNTGDNQKWDVQPSGTIPTMTLLCVATKKYATYQSLKPGTELRSDGKAQKLLIYPADKGAYYIGPEDKPGYVYTLYGRDNLLEDETPICLLINHGIDAQKWIFESV